MKQNPKTKRSDAERAGVWFLMEACNCVIARKAIRTQWQSVDFFASDVVGKKSNGEHVYAQVTAGQIESVRQRRRKLEAIPWHTSDSVFLLQLRHVVDPKHKGRRLWSFRVHAYALIGSTTKRVWRVLNEAYPVPTAWFRAYKFEQPGDNADVNAAVTPF